MPVHLTGGSVRMRDLQESAVEKDQPIELKLNNEAETGTNRIEIAKEVVNDSDHEFVCKIQDCALSENANLNLASTSMATFPEFWPPSDFAPIFNSKKGRQSNETNNHSDGTTGFESDDISSDSSTLDYLRLKNSSPSDTHSLVDKLNSSKFLSTLATDTKNFLKKRKIKKGPVVPKFEIVNSEDSKYISSFDVGQTCVYSHTNESLVPAVSPNSNVKFAANNDLDFRTASNSLLNTLNIKQDLAMSIGCKDNGESDQNTTPKSAPTMKTASFESSFKLPAPEARLVAPKQSSLSPLQQNYYIASNASSPPLPPTPPPPPQDINLSVADWCLKILYTILALFSMYWSYAILILLIAASFYSPGFFLGFLWGVYATFVALNYLINIYFPIDQKECSTMEEQEKKVVDKLLADAESGAQNVVYRGWMNYIRHKYKPSTNSLSHTRSVFVRLDSDVLRLSLPKVNTIKHSFWNEPKFESVFVDQEMYNIAGARVVLRPKRLARRRWFSRKYPICIYLYPSSEKSEQAKAETDSSDPPTSSSENELDEEALLLRPSAALNSKQIGRSLPMKSTSSSMPQLNSVEKRHEIFPHSTKKLYLFARSAREKEQWFHRLKMATGQHAYRKSKAQGAVSENEAATIGQSQSVLDWILYACAQKQFFQNMATTNVKEKGEAAVDTSGRPMESTYNMQLNHEFWGMGERLSAKSTICHENIVWLNAIFTRIFMDCSKDPFWIKALMNVVEMKLATIRLPFFIEVLKLSKLDLGKSAPRITGIHEPCVNDWGLWVDMDIEYFGDFCLAFETKVNLMKLKNEGRTPHLSTEYLSRYWDDEVPNSPESSEDEADKNSSVSAKENQIDSPKEKSGHKFMDILDRITKSRYFQGAMEYKFVKKHLQDLSETPFMLLVDFIYLEGTLAINIPLPPSDRLWYGFRYPPKISLKARPKVGERSLHYKLITDWIENKMLAVFEKNLVIPNMDDIIVPLMAGSPLLKEINT